MCKDSISLPLYFECIHIILAVFSSFRLGAHILRDIVIIKGKLFCMFSNRWSESSENICDATHGVMINWLISDGITYFL